MVLLEKGGQERGKRITEGMQLIVASTYMFTSSYLDTYGERERGSRGNLN